MPGLPRLRFWITATLFAFLAGAAVAMPAFVPAYERDFPDPFVLEHDGEYIAYSTNSDGINLPMAASRDLIDWQRIGDPNRPGRPLDGMPQLASWAKKGHTWAPEVMKIGGRWLLYYTARHRGNDLQCVGVASAPDPRGPFRDLSADPLVCQDELGGSIDPNPFRDADGRLYLYFKNDGNRVGRPTDIWGQALSADGLSLVGRPVALLSNDQPWEAHVVEASSMVRTPGGYAMLYSANDYGWEPHQTLSPYAMGYATCRTPLGPCTDAPENPILSSFNDLETGCLSGPGHQSFFRVGGRGFIAFHAWASTADCRKARDKRYLYIAPLSWKDGKPQIGHSLRRPAEASGSTAVPAPKSLGKH